ncbi:MAG: hypothetical protein H6Q56_1218, partial [Deltaproteobacteria bacterium]|nr:hypothetical protein [Deltaproteobacteria bacterium]
MGMKPLIIFLLLLPLFSSLSGEAMAAPPSALLLLGDFSQKVDLEYRYSGYTSDSGGSTSSHNQNYFREEYNFQIPYAVFNPRIWRGTLGFGVRLEQDSTTASPGTSTSSSGTGFKYNFTGSVLERSFFPLSFFSRSEQTHA